MNSHSQGLWLEACQVLGWHNKGAEACVQTLNRLWRKSPWMDESVVLPLLTESQFFVAEELWPLQRLVTLLHPKQRTANIPKSVTPPIIVVRWAGTDYLIDGRTRINHWERLVELGPHRVLVIEQAQQNAV